MVHSRLKTTEVAPLRERLLAEQGGRCALCRQPVKKDEACLDHDHKTGYIRAVLHRGCNAQLGHIENNMPRHKLTNIAKLTAFLSSIPEYISRDWTDQPLRRNAKARKARAAKKESEA